jgi:hypothetical protein
MVLIFLRSLTLSTTCHPNPHPSPVMVAEHFIFLSTDRLVNVRCCMAGDTQLFCVVDFIRRTANRRMGPLDALQYWMDISLRLQSEYDVTNSIVPRFPGPFEPLCTLGRRRNGLPEEPEWTEFIARSIIYCT